MTAAPINQVFSTYKAIQDSLLVSKHIMESPEQTIRTFHKGTVFWGKQADEFEPQMLAIVAEFDDIMVLALFAAFERELRISIQNILNATLHTQDLTVLRLVELTSESIERCAITDMLFALRAVVDGRIRGQVKQVYDYRNWVAHGKNQNRVPAINASPRLTFKLLSEFITQASVIL